MPTCVFFFFLHFVLIFCISPLLSVEVDTMEGGTLGVVQGASRPNEDPGGHSLALPRGVDPIPGPVPTLGIHPVLSLETDLLRFQMTETLREPSHHLGHLLVSGRPHPWHTTGALLSRTEVHP